MNIQNSHAKQQPIKSLQHHLHNQQASSLSEDIENFGNFNNFIDYQSNNDSNNQQSSSNNNNNINYDSYNDKLEFASVNKDTQQMKEFQNGDESEQNDVKSADSNKEYLAKTQQLGHFDLQHKRVNNYQKDKINFGGVDQEVNKHTHDRNRGNKLPSQTPVPLQSQKKDINFINRNGNSQDDIDESDKKQQQLQGQELYIDDEISNIDNKQRDTNNLQIKNINQPLKDHSTDSRVPNQQQQNDKKFQLKEEEDYFNLDDSKKLDDICQKVHFVRNSLSKNFGKLQRNGLIIENDSLLGVDKEFELTEKQRRQRDQLIHSLRRRSQIFLVLNAIWIVIIGLTYIEAQDWFKMNTLDSLSLDLLVTANGFTIMEMILWMISIIIGLNGIVNFSIVCLRIYQVGILITIIFEFLVNIILMNFVPISLAKSFVIMIFHCFFICAGKIVQNAMLAFRQRYVPILYHCQQNFEAEEVSGQKKNQMRASDDLVEPAGQVSKSRGSQQDVENNLFSNSQDKHKTVEQPNFFPQNLQQFPLLSQPQSNQQQQQAKQSYTQHQKQNQCNLQLEIIRSFSNPDKETQESSDHVFQKQVQAQKSDKKQVQSVVELENREVVQQINKKSEIGSFPVYEKNQEKSQSYCDISPQKNNNRVIFNHDEIPYSSNANFHTQEFQKSSSDAMRIHRKETTVSSNAQGSSTTLPSNNFNHQRNNPSQICPNLEDIELNIETL